MNTEHSVNSEHHQPVTTELITYSPGITSVIVLNIFLFKCVIKHCCYHMYSNTIHVFVLIHHQDNAYPKHQSLNQLFSMLHTVVSSNAY